MPGGDILVNCRCTACRALNNAGCEITQNQFAAHKRSDRMQAEANTRLAQLKTAQHPPTFRPPDQDIVSNSVSLSDTEDEGRPINMDLNPPEADNEDQKLLGELIQILKGIEDKTSAGIGGARIVFSQPPFLTSQDVPGKMAEEDIDKMCLLHPNIPSNFEYHEISDLLAAGEQTARLHQQHNSAFVRSQSRLILETVDHRRRSLRKALLQEWKTQARLADQAYLVDTTRYFRSAIHFIPPSLLLVYLLVASLYLLSNISETVCQYILSCLGLLLQINAASSTDIRSRNAARGVLRTVGPVINLIDILPRYTSFICCVKCYFIHWYDPGDPQARRMERCPNVTKNGVCDSRLWGGKPFIYEQDHDEKARPVRVYPYQSPQEYLSYLFSRSDLKDYLYRDPCKSQRATDTWDIWDADALRNFKFFDGKRYTDNSEESRLVFSLNMDGLNPYGNKQSGKKVSVGAIYMVCLNLPPDIRYNLENVYLVGIIPGPGQPSLHELNHLLKPLVDDFLILWREGIYLSRTFSRPHGIRVRGAVVPLVCDLPAARQMSGFASHSHTIFCSECKLERREMENIDPETWEMRTWEEHKRHAKLWREAETTSERRSVYAAHGVRWSELLRLPYWDPTKYTLIDSMHAFYLRLFQHHVRTIWGMDIKINDGEGPSDPALVPPSEAEMLHAHFVLRNGSAARLGVLKRHLLRQLCMDIGAPSIDGLRDGLLAQLLQYRIDQKWWTVDGMHIVDEPVDHVEGYETLRSGVTTDDFFWNASKTMVTKAIKSDLLMVFQRHVRPTSHPTMSDAEVGSLKREYLVRYIQTERHRLGIIDENGIHATALATHARNQSANILGKGILKEIRRDMQAVNRPSWQPSGPRSPGEARFGKFTAAQWRTFCLIHLPVTLTRIWGSADSDSFQRKCLDNFMDLVAAVKLASMNRMTEDRIQEYDRRIKSYLSSLLDLYPGQLERTMFVKFCSAQRIRALFAQSNTLPEALAPMVDHFHETYTNKYHLSINEVFLGENDRPSDNASTWTADDLTPIEPGAYHALFFSTLEHHRNNSQVSFQMPEGWVPGTILNLFSHTRVSDGVEITQTFAIISPYEELTVQDTQNDHYRRYPIVAGRLVYNRHQRARYLVPFSDVISHLVTEVQDIQGIDRKCLLVLPLDRH
ncbi:hypothetical protein D9611_013480 [Ephemerocybe angulata]|uniref:Uncharacterized protein n=1 Tax=Ephemerocybe angulata TaxID=980116 RepID=A0A8H5BUY9_9AGAR|nr:hypothetical protein D9611_013480 [Tulosesus angulatus]